MANPRDMWVAVLRVDLLIPGARSLKDKRQAVRSLKERLAGKFGVSAAEVGDLESWNRAALGLAAVSNDRALLEQMADEIGRYVQNDARVLVTGIERDITPYSTTA